MCLECLKKEKFERCNGFMGDELSKVTSFMIPVMAKETIVRGYQSTDYETWKKNFKDFLDPIRQILALEVLQVRFQEAAIEKSIQSMYMAYLEVLNGAVPHLAYLKDFTTKEVNEALDDVVLPEREMPNIVKLNPTYSLTKEEAIESFAATFRKLIVDAIRDKNEEIIEIIKTLDEGKESVKLLNFLMNAESAERGVLTFALREQFRMETMGKISQDEIKSKLAEIYREAVKSASMFISLLDDEIIIGIQAGELFFTEEK